jgi:hypothetical protein
MFSQRSIRRFKPDQLPIGDIVSSSSSQQGAQRRLVVICQSHKAADLPSPTTSSLVRRIQPASAARLGRPGSQGARPVDDLKRMLERLPGSRVGTRDRGVLLLGFAGAFRGSKLVALDVADLEFSSAGLAITLRNQDGPRGPLWRIGIPYGSSENNCSVRSLQALLESARITQGAVFRSLDKFQWVQPKQAVRHGRGTHCQATGRGGRTRSVAVCWSFAESSH